MQQIGNPIRVYEIFHFVATILGANSKILFANSVKYLGHTKELFIKHYVNAQAKSEGRIRRKLTQKAASIVSEETLLYIVGPRFAPTEALKAAF